MNHQEKEAVRQIKKELAPQMQEADKNMQILELVKTENAQGRKFWVYLAVLPSKHIDYKMALDAGRGTMNLLDYGKVLESGWGEEPDDATKAKMKEEHGFDENFEQQATELLQKAIADMQAN